MGSLDTTNLNTAVPTIATAFAIVFEPSLWQRFWASSPQVGFAASGLLATAILVHGYTRPATVINNPAPVQQLDEQAMQRRIDNAVLEAVAQIERRNQSKVASLSMKSLLSSYTLSLAVFIPLQRLDGRSVRAAPVPSPAQCSKCR